MVYELQVDRMQSPIGEIVVVVDRGQLCALDFGDDDRRLEQLLRRRYGAIRLVETPNPSGVSDRLLDYLAGDYRSVDAIPVAPAGTPFQRAVWSALRAIPPGTTLTYGQLACRLGKPAASRAVGAANGQNPISIVIPCHRLVGANHSLRGYAGGLDRKRWLLQHEGVDLAAALH